MFDETIKLSVEGNVAWVILNRPDRLNAFTPEMHGSLRSCLDQVEASEDIRCLVLTGAGRGFCTGQDLALRRFRPGVQPDLGVSLERDYNPLVRRLQRSPYPVVCSVNGVAAGAGSSLALSADIVIAARNARFVQSFGRVGLIPDAGGTYWLPRLLGPARARAVAMLGESIDAKTAAEWGLIWRCVEDDALPAETRTLANRLAASPTKGVLLTRRALAASAHQDLNEQLDLECDLQRQAGATADYREGVAAFVEKRQPIFRGR